MSHKLLLILLLAAGSCFAQRNTVMNLKGFDRQRKLHFGFYVGTNYLNGRIKLNDQLYSNDTVLSVNVKPQPGFSLGIVVDAHLGEYWDVRALFPTLVFGQRDFIYRVRTEDDEVFEDVRIVESTYLSMPIELKYKSARYGNFRSYLIGGGDIGYDLVSQKDVDENDKSVIRFSRWDYSWSVGLGVEFFLEYFKFAPQIKWNFGINNLLINDNTPFTNIIDRMNSQSFVLSLTFEG